MQLTDLLACDKDATKETFTALTTTLAKTAPSTKVIPYPFNVAKEDETLLLIDEVLTAFGRLDVWVCSSGLLGPPSITDTAPSHLQQLFEAHSLAPFFALKYAPPAMAKLVAPGAKMTYPNAAPKTQKYGSIVVISSVASTYGGCWGPGYTMAAHAALGVVRAGVAVLKGSGVRINCISAGQIDVGVDLQGVSLHLMQCYERVFLKFSGLDADDWLQFDMRGMTSQFPPATMQTKEVSRHERISWLRVARQRAELG
jgi:NAD(P)-dependent dehydrogenase (short-subunit alcohol dehydrogenase family)